MNRLTARDLMTAVVVTVPLATPVFAIARLLAERGISAVPVLGEKGDVMGIVTEADLIRRLAGEEDRPASWFRTLFSDAGAMADRFARTHGLRAADVMTEDVVSVTSDMRAGQVAALMEERGIRRVLVIEDGRLRGIVSRADLLRALVAPSPEPADCSDERIRRAMLVLMRRQPWVDGFHTIVEVKDGIVEFHGFMRDDSVRRGLRVLAESVPGVRGVRDETIPMPSVMMSGT
ncbi:CBS domain-containing protein [Sabulicella rubraurantiaca]|uniref:CBS domain-containing protein n=1 Tax=Sabulicella rubraurantiaca TaxID=2811429 RepID=UPI001F1AC723|nr:CBS domain-containing protein [Sabulicella rubraurantiaca]